ncbi:MAG: hypothetical protein LQ346_003701 [Caloplaca aetnensis]|nr:MAG: hypothetical protein LQ346_003701 [Caloplaca aetnensis]
MAYIPSVVPRAPSIPRIRVELAPGIPPTPQAPRPTKATLIQDKTSVSGSKGLASVPADHESAPPVQAQHNHPAVYASLVERIENSLGSGSLAPEHPSQESPPPQPGYPSRALSPPRQARQAYPAPGYHFPSPASYSSPDFILPLQLPRGYRGPGYPAPGHSIPTEPGYPAAPSYALPTHLGCPLPGYPLPGYPSPHYTSPGHHSSGYPGFADPSSGYRSHITQSTAARPSASAIFTPLHGSSGHKRALEAEHDDDDDDESAQPSGSDQAKKKRKQAVQGVKEDEKALIARYMKMEIDAENRTESKWQNVSGKLWTNHGIQRSGNSVKAWWSRQGRQEFGIDERKNPNGRKLVTSKQDPDERKRARERKKLEATEGTREKGKS